MRDLIYNPLPSEAGKIYICSLCIYYRTAKYKNQAKYQKNILLYKYVQQINACSYGAYMLG